MTAADVAETLRRQPSKLTDDDVTEPLRLAAQEWLQTVPLTKTTLPWLADVKKKQEADSRQLSVAQARGVLNCWRAEERRKARPTTPRRNELDAISDHQLQGHPGLPDTTDGPYLLARLDRDTARA